MRKIGVLAGLIFISQLSFGQRFFYIQGNPATGKLLSEGLKQAFQYVTSTPLASDYILKSEMTLQSGSHTFMINLILQDSVTFKTIYEANEAYTIGALKANPKIFFSMAVRTFIEKNMDQMILCAKDEHNRTEQKWLAPRKDKT
jgi:hypothetical protein